MPNIDHSFSVIMPAYNAEKTIRDSIISVLEQTHTNFELLIINDNSSDETLNIIKSFSDNRIKVITNEKNLGVAESRNKGIKLSSGRYIAFLDSDDLWFPVKLEKQFKVFLEGYKIVCSAYITIDNDFFSNQSVFFKENLTYSDMLYSNFIGNLTGVYDSLHLKKVYQKKIGHEDYIMWLELMKIADCAFCIKEPLAAYRISNKSLSSNKLKAMKWQWNIYRKELNLNFMRSAYYFSYYIFNAFKKRKSKQF